MSKFFIWISSPKLHIVVAFAACNEITIVFLLELVVINPYLVNVGFASKAECHIMRVQKIELTSLVKFDHLQIMLVSHLVLWFKVFFLSRFQVEH